MSGMGEFLQAAKMFKDGIQDVAISNAMTDAADQMKQMQQQQLSKEEALTAGSQIADNLALRLGGLGADAAKIQSTAGRLGLSNTQVQGNELEKEAAQTKMDFTAGENQLDRDLKRDLSLTRNEQMAVVKDEKLMQFKAKTLEKSQKEFNASVKDLDTALEKGRTAIELVDANNPIADNALGTFFAKMSGEVGNLTEAERAMFKGSVGLWEQAKQAVSLARSGKITPANRKYLKELAQKMMASSEELKKLKAQRFAKGRASAFKKFDLTEQDFLDATGLEINPESSSDKSSGGEKQNTAKQYLIKSGS